MTISAPRFHPAPFARLGRSSRILAIVRREFLHRANWGTLLGVMLTFTAVVLTIVFDAEFGSLGSTLTPATFETPFESPIWPFLILIVATAAGSGAIAEDVGNRSITLYLSRPIRRLDYLAAKTCACGSWIVLAAVGPGVAGITIVAALGLAPASVSLPALGDFIATGVLAAVFFTGLALAISSLTNRSLYAGVGIFGLVLSLYIGVAVVAGITGNINVQYANPVTDILTVGRSLFGVSGGPGPNPAGSAAILGGSGVGLTILAYWRLARIEVVSE